MKTHFRILSVPSDLQILTRRIHRGITLIEILVVIVVIAVLAAVGFVAMGRMRNQAQSAVCMGNLKQVGSAILAYCADHNNAVIPLNVTNADGSNGGIWPVVLARGGYLGPAVVSGPLPCGKGVWTCPDCDHVADTHGGYGIVEGISRPSAVMPDGQKRISSISRPSQTWLVGDAMRLGNYRTPWYAIPFRPTDWGARGPAVGRHGSKRINVCMFDGHVEALTLEELEDGRYTIGD